MDKQIKKVVIVTGGAGYIGTHLCRRLVASGHQVISLDNYFTGSKSNHIEGVAYREGHTKDIGTVIPERNVDLIYHLGEYSRVEKSVEEPEVVFDLNTHGTSGVLEFWRNRRCKLVYAGSSTKFGDGGLARDASPYAWSKASNTELVKNYASWYNLPYAITYFYNVFGPGERAGAYGTVIEIFRQQYASGQPLTVVAPGTQLRNFTHVDDIVDGLIVVGEKGEGDEYGLGNEKSFSVLEVARLFGTDIVMLPERQGNRMTSALTVDKSRTLGWRAKTTLEDELHEYVQGRRSERPSEKRVLVISTTFYPVAGPAEEALCDLMRAMPSIHFDIVTARYARLEGKDFCPVANATVHYVGLGYRLDKFLLPIFGYLKARDLVQKNQYLFVWSLMASYASLAALLLKKRKKVPMIVTLADQEFHSPRPVFAWMVLQKILRSADQIFATSVEQEDMVTRVATRTRVSIGDGDAFANQLRFTYRDMVRKRTGKDTLSGA